MEKLQIVVNLSKDTVRKVIKHDINLEELITEAVSQEILRSKTPQEEVVDWEGEKNE